MENEDKVSKILLWEKAIGRLTEQLIEKTRKGDLIWVDVECVNDHKGFNASFARRCVCFVEIFTDQYVLEIFTGKGEWLWVHRLNANGYVEPLLYAELAEGLWEWVRTQRVEGLRHTTGGQKDPDQEIKMIESLSRGIEWL